MKDITAVTGKYNDNNGQEKAEFTKIGVMGMSPQGKEYIILDTAVCLSGVLMKQNMLALQEGKQQRKDVMCNVFERNQGQQQQNQNRQQPQQQNQGHQQRGQQNQQNQNDPNNDIPFG